MSVPSFCVFCGKKIHADFHDLCEDFEIVCENCDKSYTITLIEDDDEWDEDEDEEFDDDDLEFHTLEKVNPKEINDLSQHTPPELDRHLL